jgi:hypothetical protein
MAAGSASCTRLKQAGQAAHLHAQNRMVLCMSALVVCNNDTNDGKVCVSAMWRGFGATHTPACDAAQAFPEPPCRLQLNAKLFDVPCTQHTSAQKCAVCMGHLSVWHSVRAAACACAYVTTATVAGAPDPANTADTPHHPEEPGGTPFLAPLAPLLALLP